MHVGILDVAYHLPERVVTNDELQAIHPDWRMGEVYEKSGIRARHVAAEGETAADLGCRATEKLFERSSVAPGDIDYLLFCSQAPDYLLPTTACMLQDRLGLPKQCGALDFNLGCSGYVYGLQMAKCLIAAGQARKVLLITADTYSKYIHPRDRTVVSLFGDGAAATLVGPTDGDAVIGEFLVGTDGRGAKNLMVPSGGARLARSPETAEERTDETGCVRSQEHLFMDGQAIFGFAITVVPRLVKQLLSQAELTLDDVDLFLYHQANAFMLDHLARRSKIPAEKMVVDVETIGNTVSSSIPIALARCVESGRLQAGHRLLLVGFGVGYSWGACDVVWG